MRLEIQDEDQPDQVWLARIIENVGGRLYLRIEGLESGSDFWRFYLNHWLHPIGWAKSKSYSYKPPKGTYLKFDTDHIVILTTLFK